RRAIAQGAAGPRGLLNMRREVVSLAAKRDRELGEEFLAQMDESRKAEESATAAAPAATQGPAPTPGKPFNPDSPPPAMMQRLGLAQQLLDDGDTEHALQFADPALYPVNTFGMNILNTLREKDAPAADKRFMALVTRAASDPAADANSVSLLASYPFTPFLYVTVRPDGAAHTRQWRGNTSPPEGLDPRVREAFLNAAAQILLRPLPPKEEDRSSSGRIGGYVVTTRMLPLFERHAPDKAALLRARQSLLAQDTPEKNRSPDDKLLTRGVVPEDPNRDKAQEALDKLEQAKTPAQRLLHLVAVRVFGHDAAREEFVVGATVLLGRVLREQRLARAQRRGLVGRVAVEERQHARDDDVAADAPRGRAVGVGRRERPQQNLRRRVEEAFTQARVDVRGRRDVAAPLSRVAPAVGADGDVEERREDVGREQRDGVGVGERVARRLREEIDEVPVGRRLVLLAQPVQDVHPEGVDGVERRVGELHGAFHLALLEELAGEVEALRHR
ncbi:MAG TPA: hypothetical protein VF654_03085, partial [Pyrinomonadaceae bacterium]